MIAVVDYGAGNIRSLMNTLRRLGADCQLTSDPVTLRGADKVVFPGQGEARYAMASLRRTGLVDVLPKLTQPFFGICLGQQLLCVHSEEHDTPCLGVFPERVRHFPDPKNGERIPHMGWNDFTELSGPLMADVELSDDVYFVHSYYCELGPNVCATTDYILPFAAAMQRDNFYATQFHPEKSAGTGERILRNFLEL